MGPRWVYDSGEKQNGVSMRRVASAAVLFTVWALALPAAALAKPFTLDPTGLDPHIAVEESGAAHIAWTERAAGDEPVHYCKLPRGANGCAIEKLIAVPEGEDDAGPRVFLEGGEVFIVTSRCCAFPSPLLKTYVLRSADGGQTFSPPRAVGSSEMSFGGDAYFGPGGFSISTIGSVTAGTFFQASPLSAGSPVEARARLNDTVGEITYEGSIGFLNPLTPITAFTDLENLYTRRYGGFGDHNSIANWEPVVPLGPGDEPRIASGLKGTYLIYRQGQPGRRRLKVKRYDEATRSFVSPTPVSAKGDPRDRDFFEDGNGNLHAAWVDDNESPDRVRYRRAVNGIWGKTTTFESKESSAFLLDLGAAEDGGGWTVWSAGTGESAIRVAPFGPVGAGEGGGGGCVPKITYGKAVMLATPGCFERKGKVYTATGSMRLNGLDLSPGGGDGPGAGAAAKSKITIDLGKGTLTSNGKVLVKAGNIQLESGKLGLKLPKGGGQIKDLAGNPALFDTEKLKSEFLDLPVSGKTSPRLSANGELEIPVNLKLPDPFSLLLGGTVTGGSKLVLDNQSGLIVKKGAVQLRANDLSLGLVAVRNLHLIYADDPSLLQGGGGLFLAATGAGIETNFGLRDGEFDYGNGSLDLPGTGIPIAPLVFLKQLNFAINTNPLKLAGGGKVNAGPPIGGNAALAQLNGTISYTFPDAPEPGILRIDGKGSIVSIPVGTAFAQYKTSGRLDVGAEVKVGFGPVDFSEGSLAGAVDLNSGAFTLNGSAKVNGIPLFDSLGAIEVTALLSNKALAGCASISPFGSAGAALFWGGGYDIFGGCNLGKFKTVKSAKSAATQTTFQLGSGLPHAGVVIDGTGPSPPQVRLVGPGGAVLQTPAANGQTVSTPVGAIERFGSDGNTYAMLDHPAAGTWRVESVSGGDEIGAVRTADGLPAPRVSARVAKGKGRKRTLRYGIRRIPGQKVVFMEQGNGVAKRLGAVSGGRGKLRFKSADGPKGRRLIIATVLSSGLPRQSNSVAVYEAPKPIKLGKPRKLRVRRKGTRLVVSWRKVVGAKGYAASILLKDGRRLSELTKRPKLTVKQVPGIDSAKIRVAAVKADNTPGGTAKATLKPKPKKRRKGKRKGEGRR